MRTLSIRIILAIAVVALATACAGGDPAAAPKPSPHHEEVVYRTDYPKYSALLSLYRKATLVVIGHVEPGTEVARLELQQVPNGDNPEENPNAGAPTDGRADLPEPAADNPDVVTVRQFRVTQVFKGKIGVGETIDVKQLGGQLDGVTYVEEDSVALDEATGSYLLFLETYPNAPASLLSPLQGQYPVDSGGVPRSIDGNPVKFTLADLRRLVG